MANLTKANLSKLEIQNGVTGNIETDGSTNEIYPGAALMWDTTKDLAVINAAGANKFAGIAIEGSDADGTEIEIYRSGIAKVPSTAITGTPEVGTSLYLNDTDNIRADLTTTATSHTFFGNIVGKEGTDYLVDFDVARTRP